MQHTAGEVKTDIQEKRKTFVCVCVCMCQPAEILTGFSSYFRMLPKS